MIFLSKNISAYKTFANKMLEKEYLGIRFRVFPDLCRKISGLRGVTLIGGAPGIGKTTFGMEMILDILAYNHDISVGMFSLELSYLEIMTRIISNVYEVGFMEAFKLDKFEVGIPYLSRFSVLSKKEMAIAAEKGIKLEDYLFQVNQYIKQSTNTSQCILFIDSLNLIPFFEDKMDIKRDDALIESLKAYTLLTQDPLLVISEVNKTGGYKGQGMESIKGSTKITHTVDIAIVVSHITKEELCRNIYYDSVNRTIDFYSNPEEVPKEAFEPKSKFFINQCTNITKYCKHNNIDFKGVEIAKNRHGNGLGYRLFTFKNIVHRYMEGLHKDF